GWVGIRDICTFLAGHTISFEETHAILDQLLRAKIIEECEIDGELHVRMSTPLRRQQKMTRLCLPKLTHVPSPTRFSNLSPVGSGISAWRGQHSVPPPNLRGT